jgi:hypothetical protein
VLLKHGHQPTTVLVDLPCTLFMNDNRNLTLTEDIAKLLEFSPNISVRVPPVTLTTSPVSILRTLVAINIFEILPKLRVMFLGVPPITQGTLFGSDTAASPLFDAF